MKTVAEAVNGLKTEHRDIVLNETEFMGEMTLEVHKTGLLDALAFLKRTPEPGYEVLMDLTGVDYLGVVRRTKVVYWLHHPATFQRLRVVVFVAREEALPSVTSLWEGADWYERELFDMFGVSFEGHPGLTRLLMPDEWEGHPLRRDYPLTEEPVAFKHGVTPKVPSEIIAGKTSQKFII